MTQKLECVLCDRWFLSEVKLNGHYLFIHHKYRTFCKNPNAKNYLGELGSLQRDLKNLFYLFWRRGNKHGVMFDINSIINRLKELGMDYKIPCGYECYYDSRTSPSMKYASDFYNNQLIKEDREIALEAQGKEDLVWAEMVCRVCGGYKQ